MLAISYTAYDLIIGASLIVIISYIFGEIAKRTSIPSVLLLIILGMGMSVVFDVDRARFEQPLQILGIIGLIMIVLEGALDLSLKKEKLPLIGRALAMALGGLTLSIFAIADAFYFLYNIEFTKAMLYATPLAIISSAIIIPSIQGLNENNREFMIYESCLSDILGIMFFYFVLDMVESGNLGKAAGNFTMSFVASIGLSLILSFGLIILFKYIKGQVKLFMFIAILFVTYAVGKGLHLSPLLLILFFGLILKNHELIFRGKLKGVATRMELRLMERNFHIITRETAFVLRTFFFVIFGLTITLGSLFDMKAFLLSLGIILVIFGVRYVLIKVFQPSGTLPLLFLAPRGLITVLLYFTIPSDLRSSGFSENILLFVILFTSLIMSYGLVMNRRKEWDKPRPAYAEAAETDADDDVPEGKELDTFNEGGDLEEGMEDDKGLPPD